MPLNTSGVLVREYIWLNGEPLAQIDKPGGSEAVLYLHTDHLATSRFASNSAGSVVWIWDSGAFGKEVPTGTATVNLRFPGQYFDSETTLFYNWNRYYNPATGRYISSDPVGLAVGLATYNYASVSPVMQTDPSGLLPQSLPPDVQPKQKNIKKCGLSERCEKRWNDMKHKYSELQKELDKYDPVTDGIGGHTMQYGSGLTTQGGHYIKIKNFQRGLKNDLQWYRKNCENDDDDDFMNGPNAESRILRTFDAAASQYIEPPVYPNSQADMPVQDMPTQETPTNNTGTTAGGVLGIILIILIMAPS